MNESKKMIDGIQIIMGECVQPTQWGGRHFAPFYFLSIPATLLKHSFYQNQLKIS